MNYAKVLVCLFALISPLSHGAETRGDTVNGFQFFDPGQQSDFLKALEKEGIAFHQRKDGMVIYSPNDEEKVKIVRMTILNTSFTPSYHFENERFQLQFMQRLKSRGIPFATQIKYGKSWVTWSEKDDAAVQKIRENILDEEIKR